jgi:hypothetical protein
MCVRVCENATENSTLSGINTSLQSNNTSIFGSIPHPVTITPIVDFLPEATSKIPPRWNFRYNVLVLENNSTLCSTLCVLVQNLRNSTRPRSDSKTVTTFPVDLCVRVSYCWYRSVHSGEENQRVFWRRWNDCRHHSPS